MLMVNNIEKLLNSKLESFEKVVNEELENLIHHNLFLILDWRKNISSDSKQGVVHWLGGKSLKGKMHIWQSWTIGPPVFK